MPTIRVTEFIELDLQHDPVRIHFESSQMRMVAVNYIDILENPQTANRYLCNPVHNLIINTLQSVSVSADSILHVPVLKSIQHECGFRSATIPQYFTNAWLTRVSTHIGIITGLQPTSSGLSISDMKQISFEDRTHDFRMNYYANFSIVSFPQRPEYLQYGFPSSQVPVRRLTDTSDYLFEQSATMINGSEEIPATFLVSVTSAFRIDAKSNKIKFPRDYGCQLHYSDIALSTYRWISSPDVKYPSPDVRYPQSSEQKIVLKVNYDVDFDLAVLFQILVDILISRNHPDAENFVKTQFASFNLPISGLNSTYRNLYATWIRTYDVTIPPGLSKSHGSATFLPTRGRLIYAVPYASDHTQKIELQLEVNMHKHILHTIIPKQKLLDSYHISPSLVGPLNPGICWHQHPHVASLQKHIWNPGSKGPIINHPHKVILRTVVKHDNPHDRFIDGTNVIIIYWEALDEIPFDPDTQVFPDDICLTSYVKTCSDE